MKGKERNPDSIRMKTQHTGTLRLERRDKERWRQNLVNEQQYTIEYTMETMMEKSVAL